MILRRHIIFLVLAAAVLPVVVGVLAVFMAAPPADDGRQDELLARVTAGLVMRDLHDTARVFGLGTELFDLASLSDEETIGVLRMLYKQDDDVDIVVLVDAEEKAVTDPVYLRADQVIAGSETSNRLPVGKEEMERFLQHLPVAAAREKRRAFSDPYVDRRRNVVLVAGAVEVRVADKRKNWVLGFERSLRRIRRTLSATVGGSERTMFIVDGGGRLISHPQGERFLSRESMATHPLVARFLAGQRAGVGRWADERGKIFSGSFRRLDFLDWAVVVQLRLLPLRALGWRLPGWTWIAWSLLAVLIVLAVFRLARSSQEMIEEMRKFKDAAELREHDLKRLQASLLESGKLSAIGDLGAGVAHELNNPIGGILGLTQLLLRKKGEEDPDRRFLLRIEEEAKRSKAITSNLLRFSEQQAVDYREPLHLSKVMDSALDMLSSKLSSQGVKIIKHYDEAVPRVTGNEGQLSRTFLNVLLNAETAMPEGGRLTLSVERQQGGVAIRVSDSGRGIAAENLERVFEPFFTTKDNWKGAGLGLSEVYQIIKDHGGEVHIESSADEGTSVIMIFPAESGQAPGGAMKPMELA